MGETVDYIIEAHPEPFRLLPIIGSAAGLRQGELFGLAVDDFDFEELVITVRRQVKRLGKEYVFALPKNHKERMVPMSASLAQMAKDHIERFGTTTISLPWERIDGELQENSLLFIWPDGKPLRARLYDLVVWKPALAITIPGSRCRCIRICSRRPTIVPGRLWIDDSSGLLCG